ncbi:MOSC domain-containing protein [Lysobacter olei]
MQLSGLYIYPVKSTAPLAVEQAVVEPRGLQHDRRWMVVDEQGKFLTGRQLPQLTLVRATPDATGLVLEAPDMPSLRVAMAPIGGTLPVTVWKSAVDAHLSGAAADAWLSTYLQRPVRLVYMDDDVHRPVQSTRARPGDEVSFADGHPLMLITQAALDALNERLAKPVSMLQFRPNLVVDGAPPHAEDDWTRVRIGNVVFDVAKACTRCVFITIDPARGERDPDGEPLRTLTRYRRTPDGVTFGQHLIPRSAGVVRVGDTVEPLA